MSGLAGFAFGLASLGIWVWFIAPASAGPMVVFRSLLGQALSLRTVILLTASGAVPVASTLAHLR